MNTEPNTETAITKQPDPTALALRQQAMVEADLSDMFVTLGGFDLASRFADTLSKCALLPAIYQGENGKANCLMLLDIASRFKGMGISPLTVAQQLVPVNGKFGWQGQFVIAVINLSKRYAKPLAFRFDGEGDAYGCTAHTVDHEGNTIEATKITMAMVKAENWTKNPKWQSMREQMLRYRAAAFFGRVNCPDLLMGYHTSDEIEDMPKSKDITAAAATADLIDAVKGGE